VCVPFNFKKNLHFHQQIKDQHYRPRVLSLERERLESEPAQEMSAKVYSTDMPVYRSPTTHSTNMSIFNFWKPRNMLLSLSVWLVAGTL
jgi:hypothetical protein